MLVSTLQARSHRLAAAARASGKFAAEIVPVPVTVRDEKTGATREFLAKEDDGIRPETTFEGLSKLKPAFSKDGTTTAGNASQVTDGAAAVLAMKRSTAQKLGLQIQGVFRSFAVTGVAPDVMGIGTSSATQSAGIAAPDGCCADCSFAFSFLPLLDRPRRCYPPGSEGRRSGHQ